MNQINIKGDRHDARSGVTVYGAPNQSSVYVAIVKCEYGQVLGTSSRDKRGSLDPIGTK